MTYPGGQRVRWTLGGPAPGVSWNSLARPRFSNIPKTVNDYQDLKTIHEWRDVSRDGRCQLVFSKTIRAVT